MIWVIQMGSTIALQPKTVHVFADASGKCALVEIDSNDKKKRGNWETLGRTATHVITVISIISELHNYDNNHRGRTFRNLSSPRRGNGDDFVCHKSNTLCSPKKEYGRGIFFSVIHDRIFFIDATEHSTKRSPRKIRTHRIGGGWELGGGGFPQKLLGTFARKRKAYLLTSYRGDCSIKLGRWHSHSQQIPKLTSAEIHREWIRG